MSKVKKIIATLLMMTLVMSTVAVSAATSSPSKTKLDVTNVSVKTYTEVKYTGKAQSVAVSVVVNGKTLTAGTDYVAEVPAQTNVGIYTVNIKITGKGLYEGTVTKEVVLQIKKQAQSLKKTKAKTVKYKKTKKKAQTIKLNVKSTGNGKLVYKSSSKKIKVNSKGKVLIAKGIKKGTYKIKVYAKGTTNYNKSKTKTIKIKVK